MRELTGDWMRRMTGGKGETNGWTDGQTDRRTEGRRKRRLAL